MRARNLHLGVTAVTLTIGTVFGLTACGTEKASDVTSLQDVTRGKKVYVDVLNDCGKRGDRSGLEKNKAGDWVIDRDALVSSTKTDTYNVKVKRTGSVVEVLELNNALLGEDGDTTVSSDQYKVKMKASLSGAKWESTTDKLPRKCQSTSSTAKTKSASPTPADDKDNKKSAKPTPSQSSSASKNRSRQQQGSSQNQNQQQDTDTDTGTTKKTGGTKR